MGKFHDRMEADLEIRRYAAHTCRAYLGCMREFVGHFMRPPDELTLEEIREYQLYLTRERRISASKLNQVVAALKFFYGVTLPRDWNIQHIAYAKVPRKLPEILSAQKTAALLSSLENLKHRAILMTVYAAGLRSSEVLHLKVTDIDSHRMVIRVDQGKGRKDRYVMLSARLLELLREYGKKYGPQTWLFPNPSFDKPMSAKAINRIVTRAQKAAGIRGRVYPHLLRHCFATHLLENGTNICVIQKLLGHRSLRTTGLYTQVAKNYLEQTSSPVELLPDPKTPPPVSS